jgi:four helix bundle protein
MDQILLKQRTKLFSISIIELIEKLPKSVAVSVVSYQIAKSATSVGANYRAVCRARSNKEFISKLNIVLEEADECCFWLEIIHSRNWINVEKELKEANELTAIFVATLKTMNNKLKDEKP